MIKSTVIYYAIYNRYILIIDYWKITILVIFLLRNVILWPGGASKSWYFLNNTHTEYYQKVGRKISAKSIFIHRSSREIKIQLSFAPFSAKKFIPIYIVSVAYIFYISYIPFSNSRKINKKFYESQFDLLSSSISSPHLLYPSRPTILNVSKQAILHWEEFFVDCMWRLR